MGSLQYQSFLKGNYVKCNNEGFVHKIFQQTQLKYSNKIAIIYKDENGEEFKISYKELENSSNKLSKVLKQFNKSEKNNDSIVAISMKPSHKLLITLLSVLKAGMAYLPLDTDFPLARIKHILEEAEPQLVIIDDGTKTIYEETPVVSFNELWEKAKNESDEPVIYNNDNSNELAIVLYTSGSTGIPKGVRLPHSVLLNRLEWQWRQLPFHDDEQITIFKTALTFVDSAPEIWGALLKGRTVVVIPKYITKDPEKFIDILDKFKIQRLVLVPSLLQSLLMYLSIQENENVLKSLKLWICSGETLSLSLVKEFFSRFHHFGHTLANFYGSTEVMGDVTFQLLNNPNDLGDVDKVPIGRPLDNCIIYIVDKDLRLVSHGEIGELMVAGKNLAAGYIRGRDAQKFIDNPFTNDPEYSVLFRTGDYAKIVKGVVIYEGRTDSQIKIRGHRVDLTEVEKNVLAIPNIEKAVVLCYNPGELSQALIAFVMIKKDYQITGVQIENYLKKRLPPYMVPQITITDNIPLLINGKIDRQALLKLYETSILNSNGNECNNIACDYSNVPNELMEKAKILFPTIISVIGESGRYSIDINSNFYDLGGNSLNSIYTVTKLKDQGYQIGITDFLTAKTMKDILNKMYLIDNSNDINNDNQPNSQFIVEPINHSHREVVTHIVTESFYLKADLERWLAPDIKRNDYYELMNALWDSIVDKELSFVVRSSDENKTILGAALGFDAWDEPECTVTSKLTIVFDFLEYLEGPIRNNKLPNGKGKVLHVYMMATNQDLTPAQNVIIMNKMEDECLKLAKRKGFFGIFTTNTSPLTQQLSNDVYGYEVLLDYQVNQYACPNGYKPFGEAPNDQRAICSWKKINY